MQSGKNGTLAFDPNERPVEADRVAHAPSRTPIFLWLVVIGMMIFLLPLYLFAMATQEETENLERDLMSVRRLLTAVPTPRPEVQRFLTPLAQSQTQINQLNPVYPTLMAPHPDLPTIMATINNYNPAELSLTTLTLENNRITLNGRTVREQSVMAYVRTLEQSNLFTHVTLQSVQLAPTITPTLTLAPTPTTTWKSVGSTVSPPSPTRVPSATATRVALPLATSIPTATSTATPTTTPDLRDPYEPDDPQPRLIAVGETQQHNFYPAGDIDQVRFVVKADRYYQVLTLDLTLGVDTLITVTQDNVVIGTNDDYVRGTGNFASVVCFQSPQDGEAVVRIANKTSFYGPERTYRIKVSEVSHLNSPPCSSATPSAGQEFHLTFISAPVGGNKMDAQSFSVPVRDGATPMNHANEPALPTPMPIRFVIILGLKVAMR